MRDLDGKIALVTGGGRGVGKAIAHSLARRGAHVLINCFHSYEQAKQTLAELSALGAKADVLRASVAKEDQVERMFAEISDKFGRLDILVNNAAAGAFGPADQVTKEHFGRALDTNVVGSFWCAKQAAAIMGRGGGGIIVNVSSVGAGMVPDNYLVVGTSKAAVEALTRHLAVEFATLGVRVNTASSSLIEGQTADLFPRAAEMQKVTRESTPLGRLATADDLVGVVTFLTSELSRYVTGQVILADGGLGLGIARLPAAPDLPPPPALPPLPPLPPLPALPALPAGPATTAGRHEALDRQPAVPEVDGDPIAVVGMGLAVPGANSPEEYWRLATSGAELFVEPPGDRWDKLHFSSADRHAVDKTYQSKGGFLVEFCPDEDLAAELPTNPALGEFTTKWLRHSLHQAMRGVQRRQQDRFTFVVGYTPDGGQHLEESLVLTGAMSRMAALAEDLPDGDRLLAGAKRALSERFVRGVAGSAAFLPHRVVHAAMAGLLPAASELIMVDTACSSSLYAIDIGMKCLLLGSADIAVCGGSFALGPRNLVLFSKLQGLSTAGAVRSLDRDADGVLFSDGAGVIVLKRLSRARADGDHVLGLLAGIGSSSDGRGKAIYAPSAAGQALAVSRALASPGVDPTRIDWVLAHATGTLAGDAAELAALQATRSGDRSVQVTSNKSLIGHTGWAAGVVSVIEVILGIKNSTIPGQYRFENAPKTLQPGQLTVSAAATAWPGRPDAPRAAAVSGFGFGGTNSHLVVQEYTGSTLPTPPVDRDEPIAIVGWSAHLPGAPDRESIGKWLHGHGTPPAASFGQTYPRPPFDKVMIPPSALPTVDRSQLMILEAVAQLPAEVADLWQRCSDRTAVVVGHMGSTRNSTFYAQRCYLDEIRELLSRADPALWDEGLDGLFAGYADQVRMLVPESNEDSFAGSMPNVIPARVSNSLDLHGPNMTVDTGLESSLSAMAVAVRYLRAGEVELALVSGVNGNSTLEAQETLDTIFRDGTGGEPSAPRVAEGAVTFALVRTSTAREHGLPVLATVEPAVRTPDASSTEWAGYLGAAAALEILRAVIDDEPETTVTSNSPQVPVALVVRKVGADALPAQLLDPSSYAPGKPTRVRRHVANLTPVPRRAVRPPLDVDVEGAVWVTDHPELLSEVVRAPGSMVLSTRPAAGRPVGDGDRTTTQPAAVTVISEVTEEAVGRALSSVRGGICHVRLLTDLAAGARNLGEYDADRVRALHDLLFLVVRAASSGLRAGGSLVACLLGGSMVGIIHPFAGLFTGFIKGAALEMPECRAFTLVTTTRDPATGLAQVAQESTAQRGLPVAVLDGDTRLEPALSQVDASLSPQSISRISSQSVILAVGGSRGITAVLLKEIALRYRPTIWVLGSNDIHQDTDLPGRAEYVRHHRERDATSSVAEINGRFSRICDARSARVALAELERLSGPNKIHYLQADVRDPSAVDEAIRQVFDRSGRIDVLLNAAGVIHSSTIPNKTLADFRKVRDVKVRGYQNLKHAIGDRIPDLWCNFGSIIGFTGQAGETDYAAANDFLATAAQYGNRGGAGNHEEITLGWNLWNSVGLGSDPVKKLFLEKSGTYTRMETEEGVHHFLRELALARHDPSTVFLGDSEVAALREISPGFNVDSKRGRFFVDSVRKTGPGELEVERTFDIERDKYLFDHLVNGYPTLPGTFATEIGAEVASLLDEDRVVAGFDDIRFASFLRMYPAHRPSSRTRILARVMQRDDKQTSVRIRIVSDVVAPSGAMLAKDREHFTMTVRLRDELPPAPRWSPWPTDHDGPLVPDPYHIPNPAALLTGPFVSTRQTRTHSYGRRAEYDPRSSGSEPGFEQFLVPAVLLDGLVRVSVLDVNESGFVLLAAPLAMERIDIFETGNDADLLMANQTISLYSSPQSVDLEDGNSLNRCTAVTPDGRILCDIRNTTAVALGYVHAETGVFLAPQQMGMESAHRTDEYA